MRGTIHCNQLLGLTAAQWRERAARVICLLNIRVKN